MKKRSRLLSARKTVVSAGFMAAALFISGCGPGSKPAESEPASSDQSTEQSGTQASQSGAAANHVAENDISPILGSKWSKDVESVTAEGTPGEGSLIFHGLSVAEHVEFYRVVVEFSGEGEPGWFGSWVPRPVEQGRGENLPIAGSTFLDLNLTGTSIPMSQADYDLYYSGSKTLTLGPLEIIEDGTFEGQTHIVVGMDREREIQIGRLSDPSRVVVDIRK